MAKLAFPLLSAFERQARYDALNLFILAGKNNYSPVAEDELERLPEPARRYLRYTGIVGKPRVSTVRLRQRGFFRLKRHSNWLPLAARQYYSVNPPAYLWQAEMQSAPLVTLKSVDAMSSRAWVQTRLAGLFPVIDYAGPEAVQGSLMRFLSEITWFPSAFLSDYIHWEPIDDFTARATLTFHDQAVNGVFYFNDKGQVTQFTGRRTLVGMKSVQLEEWAALLEDYREFNGLWLPSRREVLWKLAKGNFSYGKYELLDIEYNLPRVYK